MAITREEILMGRDRDAPLTPELESNLAGLLAAVNIVRAAYGQPMYVTSGYRPGKFNEAAGGKGHSCHLTCEACDFEDKSRKLTQWCLQNLPVLEKAGLYMESPLDTATWVHLQTRRPGSGSRIFRA